jgi:hypothetical protein
MAKTAFSGLPIPNLISGVSQQPPTLRLPNALKEQINAWPSVVTGLNKRFPTQHIAGLNISLDDNAVGYLIDREGDYQYLVVISNGELQVISLVDGAVQTVNYPEGSTYLSLATNPITAFRFQTFGDTTFIANREVTVESDEFGEFGDFNFTYTTVATLADRGTGTVGQIVFVTETGKFYKWKDINAVAQVNSWRYDGATASADSPVAPVGYTNTTSLPAVVVVGAKYCIRYQSGSRQGACQGYNSHTGDCISYQMIPQYAYRKYTGIISTAGVPGAFGWYEMQNSELNRTVVGRVNPAGRATVYVTQAIGNINYNVYLNGVLAATFLSNNGSSAALSVQGTDVIAAGLVTSFGTVGIMPPLTAITRIGSTICITGLADTDRIVTTCTNGDKALKCYHDEIDAFQNLPPNETVGRIVRIKGSVENNGDDYYVRFTDKNLWQECWGWSQQGRAVRTTMPHTLIKNADGTWTFKPHDWTERKAGDRESNPQPSFVGQKITDIFNYANRLGFLADENIILSEANQFENFYRTTLATLVDSDPIDLAVLNQGVDFLYHAVPFDKDLLLMSDRNQFRLSYQNYLGPKNVNINFTTSFAVSPTVKPQNLAGSIYFVDDKDDYSFAKVWEYFPKDNAVGDDADDSTASIPEYIKSGTTFMTSSTRLKCVIVNSVNAPDTLYLYKFFWGQNTKIQNAWGKWTFPGVEKIVWAGFSFNRLYMLVKRASGLYIEKMEIDEAVGDSVHLLIDRKVDKSKLVMSYNATTDKTTITLPYAATVGTVEIVTSNKDDIWPDKNHYDVRQTVTKVNDTTYTIPGDATNYSTVYAGIQYVMAVTLAEPFMRQPKGSGEVVVMDQLRLQMRYLTVRTENTVSFNSRVAYPGRPDTVKLFDAKTIGIAKVNADPAEDTTARIPLMGNNVDCTVSLENDTPFNSQFTSAEWQFWMNMKAKNRL